MKTEITFKKVQCTSQYIGKDIFIPANQKSYKDSKPIEYGKDFYAKIVYKGKHNLYRHNLFWSCCAVISENLSTEEKPLNDNDVCEIIKIESRWIESYINYHDKNGKTRLNVVTKSIKFSEITIQEANEFYNKAFIVGASLLGITEEELVTEAKNRMKSTLICPVCGKVAHHRHHQFSQTNWAIEKYGKEMIDAPFNIIYVCMDCHSSHANIPENYRWSEKKFIQEAKKAGYLYKSQQ